MTHPFERERQAGQAAPDFADHGPRAADDHASLTTKPDDQGALRQIAQVLSGKAPEEQLPELLTVLKDDDRNAFRPDNKWKQFKKVSGDIALRCAEIIEATTTDALNVALHAKTPISAGGLHRYLSHRDGVELATLDDTTIAALRAQLPAKLVEAIPNITEKVDDLADNPTLLRWFVETTAPGVCAQAMARRMNTFLADALDKHHLWSSWVDQLQAPQVTTELAAVANKIKDPHASAVISKLVGTRAGMGADALATERKAHRGELHAELAGKPTVQSLLTAAGNEGAVGIADLDRLLEAMKRLHATADDVLALSNIANLDRPRTLALLLQANGVTSQHLVGFLQQDGSGIEVLADAKIRKAVRDKAPTLTLQDTLALLNADAFHDKIVTNDGLAAWFLETAVPRDLLWFCSQNPANAARATRMARDHRGVDWVRQLTSLPEGNDKSLRILAINLHDKPSEEFIRHVLLGEYENTDVVNDLWRVRARISKSDIWRFV